MNPCFAAHPPQRAQRSQKRAEAHVESEKEIRQNLKAELKQLKKRIEALNDARKYNALVCLDQVFDLLGFEGSL